MDIIIPIVFGGLLICAFLGGVGWLLALSVVLPLMARFDLLQRFMSSNGKVLTNLLMTDFKSWIVNDTMAVHKPTRIGLWAYSRNSLFFTYDIPAHSESSITGKKLPPNFADRFRVWYVFNRQIRVQHTLQDNITNQVLEKLRGNTTIDE